MNGNGRDKTPQPSKPVNNENGRNGDPLSLYPMTPEDAIRKLLTVPPEPKITTETKTQKSKRT